MYVIVMVTCPDEDTAERISEIILRERLAACVNTMPGVTSRYWWNARIEKADEVLMLIKTREALLQRIEKAVRDNHPYDVPEVIAVPIGSGSPEYLNWIDSETGQDQPGQNS